MVLNPRLPTSAPFVTAVSFAGLAAHGCPESSQLGLSHADTRLLDLARPCDPCSIPARHIFSGKVPRLSSVLSEAGSCSPWPAITSAIASVALPSNPEPHAIAD